LLQRTLKDFDIATSATPMKSQLFRHRITAASAGASFRPQDHRDLDFRANRRPIRSDGGAADRRDNVFFRDRRRPARDFTINSLFYDVGPRP
jgi:tRNA nucleotidyltransferase/poly(A) polymerase